MPLVPRLVIAALLVLAGLVLLAVAVLGARGRLRRNRWVGVRTAETLASEAAFAVANRVAAAP
ncbi:MAG: SdpI family protein, partial [Pseudonocardia sp.]|nr:SdpI family protein [Pseudonocardia sp.]